MNAPQAWTVYQLIRDYDDLWHLPADTMLQLYEVVKPQAPTPIGRWYQTIEAVHDVMESLSQYDGSGSNSARDDRVGPSAPVFSVLILEKIASWTEIQQMTLPEVLDLHDAVGEKIDAIKGATQNRATQNKDPFEALQEWRQWKDTQGGRNDFDFG